METAVATQPPGDPAPRWPARYAIAGFFTGLMATFLVVGIAAAATGTTSGDESPAFTIVATLCQSAIFVATALIFASFTAPPRPWHFGLRRTRFWPALGWAALGMFAFYLFAAIYTAAVQPDAEQGITESLGADESTFGLVVAGIMVIAVAPVAEVLLPRLLLHRPAHALRGDRGGADRRRALRRHPLRLLGRRHAAAPAAAGGARLRLLPVYERTSSIFPVIALHAVNNTIAYGVQADAWEVSAVLGPLVIAACIAAPRMVTPLRAAPRSDERRRQRARSGQALRGHRGGRRDRLRRSGRPLLRLPGPQRRGQDHDDEDDLRPCWVDEGELSVLGLDIRRKRREVKARIGVVPQEQNLDRELTVRENLDVQALYHGRPADGRIEELLDFTLLSERADAKPAELSGGMKRRLLIARALVNRPELVVLDEPTTGLDPQARIAVWNLLERLRAEGVTLLITTHYMEEAERICDRLVIMDGGWIVSQGAPGELPEIYGERNLEGVFLQVAGHELPE